MAKELFGTDGIRGKANQYPITPEIMVQVGRSVVSSLKQNSGRVKIVIGKDTRISGGMLEYALASGICSMNGDAYQAGVLPTPGIAFLTAAEGFDAGVMISASHNPYEDNGIKIFNSKGFKLSDEIEAGIELHIKQQKNGIDPAVSNNSIGTVTSMEMAEKKYVDFLRQILPNPYDLAEFNIVFDCSNGATYRVAPKIFSELKANFDALYTTPDGKNINDACGSQHTETLQKKVVENNADIGLAFDGDGDRLIAVDEKGRTVSGDQILAVCAKFLKDRNRLKNNKVVSTIMSNVGLHQALKEMNIDHVTADVGDRYVLEKMIRHGAILGGEDSGHMIFLNDHTSGDGILTALKLIQVMKETQKPLSELTQIIKIYPQVLINIHISNKMDIESVPEISDVIADVENRLKDQGRVLVRYSGTQPLCRVMVEGPDEDETRNYCKEIAAVIDRKLNIKS